MMLPCLAVMLFSGAVEDELTRARALIDEYQYAEALKMLDTANEASGKTCDEHRKIVELRGIALATLGRDEDAEAAFARLVAMEPTAALPYTLSPKVTFRFEAGRKKMDALGDLRLEVNAPFVHPTDEPLPIRMRVTQDPLEEARIGLLAFRLDAGPWSTRELPLGDGGEALWRLTPPAEPGDHGLEYYLEARDESGTCLYQAGTPTLPRQLQLVQRYRPPTWPIWTGAGTTVAALGAGAVLGLLSRRASDVFQEEVGLPLDQQNPQRRSDAEDDASRFGNAANVAFVGAAVSALVTGALYFILTGEE